MTGTPKPGALETAEKIIAIVVWVISQIPAASTGVGRYRISIYQPSIYNGKEAFLIVPALVAVFSIWVAIQHRRAVWGIFVVAILLAGVVWWVYERYPATHWVHAVNWVLSYCVASLFASVVARLVIDLKQRVSTSA